MHLLRALACTLVLSGSLTLPEFLQAQAPGGWDSHRVQVSRAALEELLANFEQAHASPAYSADLRARARYEAAIIRTRLAEGDFQIGDQITLTVEGEAPLSSNFLVGAGRALTLPTIGEVPLTGILRSELEGHLTRHLQRFIKDPVVRTSSSLRVAVSGTVGRPGYYMVPAESLLSDVLMTAGGFAGGARLDRIRVERGKERIWEGTPLQQAIAQGWTLDQMSLRAGDHIVVASPNTDKSGATRWLTSVPAVLFSILTILRML